MSLDVQRSGLEMELMGDTMLVSRKAMHTDTEQWQQAELKRRFSREHRPHHASYSSETRSLVR